MKKLTTYIKESVQDIVLDPEQIPYCIKVWFRNKQKELDTFNSFVQQWNTNGQTKDKELLVKFYADNNMEPFVKFCINDMNKVSDLDYINIFIKIIENIV